jgi:signal transduction histidine kinase
VKYTKSGSITVRCATLDEPEGLRSPKQVAVEIVVQDTGCGIPPLKLERIFREFEQVEISQPAAHAEPGVGAYITHLADFHAQSN